MKHDRFQSPYAMTAALFVGVGLIGVIFFGWGEVRLAFLLLIYCLLLLAFRLDEVTRQLAAIDRHLAQLTTRLEKVEPSAPSSLPPDPPSSSEER